jgi:hypothetical protein
MPPAVIEYQHIPILDDSNREYYKAQAENARQKREDERFQKQVEDMRLAKRL